MGFNSPIENPFAQLAFEGCQWLCKTETTKKEPITSDMILVTKYGGKILVENPIFEIFINMFARIGRIFYVWRNYLTLSSNIKIQESHLEILISKSKTDPRREGHIVYISRIKSECCPVKYLEVYLQKPKLNISNDKESALIYRILKTKSGHKI